MIYLNVFRDSLPDTNVEPPVDSKPDSALERRRDSKSESRRSEYRREVLFYVLDLSFYIMREKRPIVIFRERLSVSILASLRERRRELTLER